MGKIGRVLKSLAISGDDEIARISSGLPPAASELAEERTIIDLKKLLDAIGKEFIDEALRVSNGNKSAAAKQLNLKNYQTLDNWLARVTSSKH